MAAALLAIRYGFRGPSHSVSTACSTGLHSIGDAYNFIKNNMADVMIAGGTDACINPLAISGFSNIRALSKKYKDNPTKASRPFDKDRDGFVMSEGAAVLVLEELDHAIERNANIICEVVGKTMVRLIKGHGAQPTPSFWALGKSTCGSLQFSWKKGPKIFLGICAPPLSKT